jgi:hypothetical protein
MKAKKSRVVSPESREKVHKLQPAKAATPRKRRKSPGSYASKRLRQAAFAKLGASGGKASAKALTAKQRSEKARKAANVLWAQRRKKEKAKAVA